MEHSLLVKILFAGLRAGKEMQITVSGVSINPTLFEGNHVPFNDLKVMLWAMFSFSSTRANC